MHLYGALILLVTVSAACGLRCYACQGLGCTHETTCTPSFGYCSSVTLGEDHSKSCMNDKLCASSEAIKCCSTDLCNGATPTGSSVLLLLASSAIASLFL